MKELTVFVHIGKTAGSTLNRILARWAYGAEHLEGVVEDRNRLSAVVAKSEWVSGHIPMPQFVATLRKVTHRPFRLITLIRDPFAQVTSHYNWLIEIHSRGGAFYDAHPPGIKAISESIRATDHGDPQAIIAQLQKYRGLFLNVQCRMAFGADVSEWSLEQIQRGLKAYDCVGGEMHLPLVAEYATGTPLEVEIRENKSPYHFDPAVFRTAELREFISRENAGDIALYGAVCPQAPGAGEPPKDRRSLVSRIHSAIAKRSVIPAT